MNLTEMTNRLQTVAEQDDERGWPEASLEVLSKAKLWAASIPTRFGGSAPNSDDRLRVYEATAKGHLSAALILTQHDAACELLAAGDNEKLANEVLPPCAAGTWLNSVGISHLTTSKRGPSMHAREENGGFVLNGTMPWVTSGPKADLVVTAALLPDEQQILACLPMDAPGIGVGDTMQLMGLTSSWTTEVHCKDVVVPRDRLVRGPAARVLQLRAPVKPLVVSACGLGHAGALVDALDDRAASLRGADALFNEQISVAYQAVRKRLYDAADALNDPAAEIPSMEIRVAVNDLLGKLALSLTTVLKGSGYLCSHPMQRLVREALFFLVWSAPPAVQMGGLKSTWS